MNPEWIVQVLRGHRHNPFEISESDGGRRCSCGELCTLNDDWYQHVARLITEGSDAATELHH